MRAITIDAPGPATRLQQADLPVPEAGDQEVLIAVKAISINPVDVKARANEGTLNWLMADERPAILGWDISGVVVDTGKSVTAFRPGDEVFGMINFPGKGRAYADYVVAHTDHLALKPASVTHEAAAAATLAALTAWQVLTRDMQVQQGKKVLIHAAAGGVGHYAVALAKHLGAYVTGTSSAANRDFVLSLGADAHLDYTATPFETVAAEADFIFDTMAGDTLKRSVEAARPGTTIITIPSSAIPEALKTQAVAKGVKLDFLMVTSNGQDMQTLAGLREQGILQSHVSQTFDFAAMTKAHEAVETGRTRGKVVVTL